jgi:hypothetical protein
LTLTTTAQLLDEAEHFRHNRNASVATLRTLFAFGPECRSRSYRKQRSPSLESSFQAAAAGVSCGQVLMKRPASSYDFCEMLQEPSGATSTKLFWIVPPAMARVPSTSNSIGESIALSSFHRSVETDSEALGCRGVNLTFVSVAAPCHHGDKIDLAALLADNGRPEELVSSLRGVILPSVWRQFTPSAGVLGSAMSAMIGSTCHPTTGCPHHPAVRVPRR